MRNHVSNTHAGMTILKETLVAAGAVAVAFCLSGCGTGRTVARHQDPFLTQEPSTATVAADADSSDTGVVTITALRPDDTVSVNAAAASVPPGAPQVPAQTANTSVNLAIKAADQTITRTSHEAGENITPNTRQADHTEAQPAPANVEWADYDPFLQGSGSSNEASHQQIAVARAEELIEASRRPKTVQQTSAEVSSTEIRADSEPNTGELESSRQDEVVVPRESTSTPAKADSLDPALKVHDGRFSWRRLD